MIMVADGFIFLRRLFNILRLFGSIFLKRSYSVESGGVKEDIILTNPIRLKFFFEKAGGVFLKFGQALALRNDILPLPYIKEFFLLDDKAPAVLFSEMQFILAEELGRNPSNFFSKFYEEPIASSPISQVYLAELKDGSRVAVKIQRPKIKEKFEIDFSVIIFLAGVLDFFRIFSRVQMRELVSDFILWMRSDLDFTKEAKNAEVLFHHAKNHPESMVPEQYLKFTTPKVLIQEFIENGILASSLLDISLSKEVSEKELLIRRKINIDGLALYLIRDLMRQYFIDGFFHSNPYPSNIIFTPIQSFGQDDDFSLRADNHNGKVVYLDHSFTDADHLFVSDKNNKQDRIYLMKFLYGVCKKDFSLAASSLLELGKQFDSDYYRVYEKIFKKIKELMARDLADDFEKIFSAWYESLETHSLNGGKSVAPYLFEAINKAEDYGVYFGKEALLFLRTLSAIETIALQLSDKFNIIEGIDLFFKRYSLDEAIRIIQTEDHFNDSGRKLESPSEIGWELFREIVSDEKEKRLILREKIVELILVYADKYDEVKELVKKYKITRLKD